MHYTRACAMISKSALIHNLERITDVLNEHTSVICVVKTNAYGHGAEMISEICEQQSRVWGFAVATADEARELRGFGRKKEILILSHTFHDDYEDMIENDVIMTVFDLKSAMLLSETALKKGKKARVHIKVDTGMSRIGFPICNDSFHDIAQILKLEGLSVEGIFTHFACSDEEDNSFAYKQLERFKNFVSMVEHDNNFKFRMHHAANSAAAMYLKDAYFDAVRIGVSMYGMWPSAQMKKVWPALEPVMSLKARVAMVKDIEAGTGISYGQTFVAQRTMRIATVSFGYGDGYPRSLSNKGYVLIRGHRCPILGRICMDQLIADVTYLDDVAEYDEVTLIGEDSGNRITIEELGDLSGRFNYELACDINPRVHRCII